MIRGISGGQKKRVTTGEMIVGPAKTLFLDEISTGQDLVSMCALTLVIVISMSCMGLPGSLVTGIQNFCGLTSLPLNVT